MFRIRLKKLVQWYQCTKQFQWYYGVHKNRQFKMTKYLPIGLVVSSVTKRDWAGKGQRQSEYERTDDAAVHYFIFHEHSALWHVFVLSSILWGFFSMVTRMISHQIRWPFGCYFFFLFIYLIKNYLSVVSR